MVDVLRKQAVPCIADRSAVGLYVVGESKTNGVDIPRLPSLWPVRSANSSPGEVRIQQAGSETQDLIVNCPDLFTNFSHGDVVWIDPGRGEARSILSSRSNANTLLLTEQCENRCLFCSQPPNDLPDANLYLNATLALLNFHTSDFVGLSGGEPTKNTQAFLGLLNALHQSGCPTKLHILSHGRNFRDKEFAGAVCERINGRTVVWGIPLYGHTAHLHDGLVASEGAFAETITGLSNLAVHGQEVELRTIPTRDNLEHLAHIVTFVAVVLTGIRTVSIMNMEPKGLGRRSFSSLYVPVKDQVPALEAAVTLAQRYGVHVRLFNYPLCLLSEDLREFSVQSISDWKNYFPVECDECSLRKHCGGFFSSSTGWFLEKVEAVP